MCFLGTGPNYDWKQSIVTLEENEAKSTFHGGYTDTLGEQSAGIHSEANHR